MLLEVWVYAEGIFSPPREMEKMVISHLLKYYAEDKPKLPSFPDALPGTIIHF